MIDSSASSADARLRAAIRLTADHLAAITLQRRGPDFVILIGCFLAMNALAIDAILPALALIQSDLGVASDNARQWSVIAYLAALGVSQPIAGPLTDRFGRRPAILVGFAGYALISLLCQLAPSFPLLILLRFVHGLVGGAIRVIAISLVRDSYSGTAMVSKMSIATMVMMVAPLFAPALGQLVLNLGGGWRGIFLTIMLLAVAIMIWAFVRLPETLATNKRIPLRPRAIAGGYLRVLGSRRAVGWFLVHALSMASVFTYVTLSQQIYNDIYATGDMFPVFFAAAGLVFIIANLFNIAVVGKMGIARMASVAVICFTLISLIHAVVSAGESPPLWLFVSLLMIGFFFLGVLIPTSASLAMQPFERDVGYAAALLGLSTNGIGALAGAIIGAGFQGSAVTLIWGHCALGAASAAVVVVIASGRPFAPDRPLGAARRTEDMDR